MTNQRIITAILLFVSLCGACFAGTFSRFEHQKKFWDLNAITGPIKPDSRGLYYLEIQGRIRNVGPVVENGIFRGALGYQLNRSMSLWLGYSYYITPLLVSGRAYENRFENEFIWNPYHAHGYDIVLRSRVEERRFNFSKQWQYRFRQRVKFIFPRVPKTIIRPVIWDEVFFNLNRPDWLPQTTIFNQNRFFVGMRIMATKHTNIELGYLNQYVPSTKFNADNHVLYLTVIYYTG